MKSFGIGKHLTVLASLMVISPHFTISASLDDITRLETQLFTNYSIVPRPVYNQSEVVSVSLEFYLLSIIKLDAVAGTIELSAGAVITWYDYRLTWDPNDYGGLTTYMADPTSIWYPGLFITSTADELEIMGQSHFHVDVSSTGNISWAVGKLITSSCNVDMTSFPVDTQTCTIILMPWGYAATEVVVYPYSNAINMAFSSPNGEWNIENTLLSVTDAYLPVVSALAVELTISRKSTYFIISLILPMNLLGLLTPVVFLLPASSGERISYSITMFLSLAVYMTILTDSIPKVSQPMAGITYYTFTTLIGSSAVVLLTIISLRCEAIDDVDKYPKWIIWAIQKLQKVTCCKKGQRGPQIEDGTEGGHDRDLGKHKTETELTKMRVMKYIDLGFFILSMGSTVLVTICFAGVYYT